MLCSFADKGRSRVLGSPPRMDGDRGRACERLAAGMKAFSAGGAGRGRLSRAALLGRGALLLRGLPGLVSSPLGPSLLTRRLGL